MKNKKDNIEISELFMAKAGSDYSRCFYGVIRRLRDAEGSDYCYSKITVNQGFVCARARDDKELGGKLDEIVLLILDYGLHDDKGESTSIAGTTVFLN